MKAQGKTYLIALLLDVLALSASVTVAGLTRGPVSRIAWGVFFSLVVVSWLCGTIVMFGMVLHARKTGFGFPRSARDWHRLARWMMPLGAVTILLGLGFGVRTLRFVRRARRTTGTIVQLIQGSSSQSGTVYTPVFTFTDAEGRTHRVISRVASYPPAGLVGDTVPVLYDPRDPSRARIDRFFDLWGLPAVLTGTGLFHVILFGIIAAASARKMRRAGPEVPADDASPSPHHSDFARSSSDPDGN